MNENQWIKTSDRLPEINGFWNTHGYQNSSDYVLVSMILPINNFKREMVTVGRVDYSTSSKGNWRLLYGNKNGEVVAWMPLPEPYKGE